MHLSTDTPLKTPSGASFTGPSGWSAASNSNKLVLTAPEGDSRLALVDVRATEAADAIARAWHEYRPEAKRTLRLAMPTAQRNGWEERYVYHYETSPNEQVVYQAVAHRSGE